MRIVSGTHKGRVIHPPKNLPVRPTTDFAKESIFNILNNHFEFDGLKILDLFCGTGNISYEFASRGCGSITCVDSHFHCCDFVKKTSSTFKMEQIKVIKSDVFSFLKNGGNQYHIIFADPPYSLPNIETIAELVFQNNFLNKNGVLIVEHHSKTMLPKNEKYTDERVYGQSAFTFYKN